MVRLMDCLNFKKEGNAFIFISTDYKDWKGKGKKILHWLPKDENAEVEIVLPDNTKILGKAEKNIEIIGLGDVIQFERYGFCRLDKGNSFWFTHE